MLEHRKAGNEDVDPRIDALLREEPSEARKRMLVASERGIHDYRRIWISGPGILSRRIAAVATRLGMNQVGSVYDLPTTAQGIKHWRRHERPILELPTDLSVVTTDPFVTMQAQPPSWMDLELPRLMYFHALAWRSTQAAQGQLFVMSPEQRLERAQEHRDVYTQLSSLASRQQMLRRLSVLLGRPLSELSSHSGRPTPLTNATIPTPLPTQPLSDLAPLIRDQGTEWVFDFCVPEDRWCEEELRRCDPAPWRRIRFHPDAKVQQGLRPGWLWSSTAQGRSEGGEMAANQEPESIETHQRGQQDFAKALSIAQAEVHTWGEAQAWDFLAARDPEARSLLRLQSFDWEPYCPAQAQRVGALLKAQPNWELRWESAHAIDILRSWLCDPELSARGWELEATPDPNLDAVVLRRSGR